MSTQQTEALQCAADLEYSIARHGMQDAFTLNAYRAMKMVRTQQARIADLEAQLEAIGTGGVSGPLIGQPQAMPDLSQLTERGAKAWAGVDAQGLREGFTAADMAAAAAQGFRDGVASVSAQAADSVPALDRDRIREIFMAHGFTVKEGQTDLKQYVYDAAEALLRAARAQADSVQEDAALWHWLAEYLVGTRTDLDDEIVASETVNDLRKLVEAARKQGEKQ